MKIVFAASEAAPFIKTGGLLRPGWRNEFFHAFAICFEAFREQIH